MMWNPCGILNTYLVPKYRSLKELTLLRERREFKNDFFATKFGKKNRMRKGF